MIVKLFACITNEISSEKRVSLSKIIPVNRQLTTALVVIKINGELDKSCRRSSKLFREMQVKFALESV